VTEPTQAGPERGNITLRPTIVTRVVAAVLALLGLLIVTDAVAEPADRVGILPGAVLLVGGAALIVARAVVNEHGVTYRFLRVRRVPAREITAVRMEMTGFYGPFPTLVVERSSGRPMKMVAVQGWSAFRQVIWPRRRHECWPRR
jgi:hypothetical protein